jgi:glycerol-3-phosphate acyltransferase PlsY
MEELAAVTLGYFAGSIPFAFLVARRRGIDLRRSGSGNVGATNVLRTSGVPLAVTAMMLDAMKGAVAVLIAQRLTEGPATPVAAGLAAIIGHVYPLWLQFRGGKGVATTAGVFAVLTPLALAIAAVAFVLAVFVTRYISVGSVTAALTLAAAAVIDDPPNAVVAGAIVAALVIVHRHRANLARLVAGTEPRIGQRI